MSDQNQNQNQGNQNQNKGNQQNQNQHKGNDHVEVEVTVKVNREAIHSAAFNSRRLTDVGVEVPVVNAKDLRLDDKVYSIETVPVDDTIRPQDITDDTAVCLAIKPIVVDALNRSGEPNCINVNGLYNIPEVGQRVVKPGKIYVADRRVAEEICDIITEVEWEKQMQRVEEHTRIAEFLKKQREERRW